jgi:hypothetical protein
MTTVSRRWTDGVKEGERENTSRSRKSADRGNIEQKRATKRDQIGHERKRTTVSDLYREEAINLPHQQEVKRDLVLWTINQYIHEAFPFPRAREATRDFEPRPRRERCCPSPDYM